ncbi:MAG: hypothetical protein JXA37_05285 [Chloroflexia bacterium]|nr:hypothetical protein [Chloroflexia bacterium]
MASDCAYIFCYDSGQEIIEGVMERLGDEQDFFRRLLREPWTASNLAEL